ncbi:hypothetical protein A3709_18740 [Halioglobus sp. HI00S01]|uniref:LysM peptidoglycan-binding domain-containing protein n=1 Tax=Halioglobus sp. HI00S01 TaxID=1822214 RepID=UPI0007C35C6E|nr:LysM domain-containing protein [Halioglobus sp. HI00S01]KZX57662.1 hypothetical protein A3709_18740 [Halioglobus sp. HI00S01]
MENENQSSGTPWDDETPAVQEPSLRHASDALAAAQVLKIAADVTNDSDEALQIRSGLGRIILPDAAQDDRSDYDIADEAAEIEFQLQALQQTGGLIKIGNQTSDDSQDLVDAILSLPEAEGAIRRAKIQIDEEGDAVMEAARDAGVDLSGPDGDIDPAVRREVAAANKLIKEYGPDDCLSLEELFIQMKQEQGPADNAPKDPRAQALEAAAKMGNTSVMSTIALACTAVSDIDKKKLARDAIGLMVATGTGTAGLYFAKKAAMATGQALMKNKAFAGGVSYLAERAAEKLKAAGLDREGMERGLQKTRDAVESRTGPGFMKAAAKVATVASVGVMVGYALASDDPIGDLKSTTEKFLGDDPVSSLAAMKDAAVQTISNTYESVVGTVGAAAADPLGGAQAARDAAATAFAQAADSAQDALTPKMDALNGAVESPLAAVDPSEFSTVVHEVGPDDNLWSISEDIMKQSGIEEPTPQQIAMLVEQIAADNGISDANSITPGQELAVDITALPDADARLAQSPEWMKSDMADPGEYSKNMAAKEGPGLEEDRAPTMPVTFNA